MFIFSIIGWHIDDKIQKGKKNKILKWVQSFFNYLNANWTCLYHKLQGGNFIQVLTRTFFNMAQAPNLSLLNPRPFLELSKIFNLGFLLICWSKTSGPKDDWNFHLSFPSRCFGQPFVLGSTYLIIWTSSPINSLTSIIDNNNDSNVNLNEAK